MKDNLVIEGALTGDTITSGGTDDYTLSITQTLNDSGVAGGSDVYRGLKLNLTQTDITGWDSVYLMDLQADASSVFRVNAAGGVSMLDSSGDGYYWREFHVAPSKASPGGSGATLTIYNTATLGYLLDDVTEYLYYTTDIHDDWDAASDIIVEIEVALAAAEAANDIINAEIVTEYFNNHDDMSSPKTQTRTINHDITSDNAQYTVHMLVFRLDYDLVSHVIEQGDELKMRFRLDSVAGGTDVGSVIFLSGNVKYRAEMPLEAIGTFPTEG